MIDDEGEQLGILSIEDALDAADERGLDLVEVSPNASPPVCRIMDYGKFRFEQAKKASQAKKKQKNIQVKEVKFRPGTEEADYQVKMRNVHRFLDEGNKVKLTLRFRGREMAHIEEGRRVMQGVIEELLEFGKAPVLMEPVVADITIRREGQPTVVLLDHEGCPTSKTLEMTNDLLYIDGKRDRTMYYLISY